MAGYVASGATFTFGGVRAIATRVSVESPTAEIVDMTAHNSPAATALLVPTGAWIGGGGSVDVEFLQSPTNGVSPLSVIGKVAVASFTGNTFSINNRAICETASIESSVGDVVRGTMRLRFTDYTATDSISGSSF